MERITAEEIYSVAGQKGIASLDAINLIILETTSDIAIIEKISPSAKQLLPMLI